MARPGYCEAGTEGEADYRDPCPGCGATAAGNDPVRGVCQARHNGPAPKPFLELVLIDKRDGKVIVARTTAYH